MQLPGEALFPTITGCLYNCAFSASYKEKRNKQDLAFYLHFTQLNKAPSSWGMISFSSPKTSTHAKSLNLSKRARDRNYIQPPWEFGKADNTVKLSTDFNAISVKTFSALQHIHLHVNIPVWQSLMKRGRSFQSWLQLLFQSGNKSGLDFPWFLKRVLHIPKPITFKKVVTSRNDSVPYNNGTSYWHWEGFLCFFFFISSTLYLKTCSLHCFTAKTVCKARIVLITSKLNNITCFSIISTIWACWKP